MKNTFDLTVLLLIFSVSCVQDIKRNKKSTDYIFVGDFTQGLEGPAVSADGDLFFVNPQKNGTIGRVKPSIKELEIYIDSLPSGSVANGIRFGKNDIMYLADYVNHTLLAVSKGSNIISVYASDSMLNQPNDIAITSKGILFASDPNWKDGTGNIWKVDTEGKFIQIESNMGTTNGIEVAPGDSILYVNESVQRKIWAYSLSAQGEISQKRLLIEFKDFGLDGMRCDEQGNLYIARYGKGVIAVVSPKGELLYEIELTATKPTNLAFGGEDGRSVFVTCQDRGYIETFRAEYPGRSFHFKFD